MNRFIKATLASAALAVAAGTSFAQAPQGPQHPPRAFSKPTERVEARLAYIRTALKITDAQQSQWNAYANSVRQDAAQREKKFEEFRQNRDQPRPSVSAVERLERQQRMLTEAAAQVNARLAAVKPLYESLNPEQKKVADVVLVREGRGGHRHGHMHRQRA